MTNHRILALTLCIALAAGTAAAQTAPPASLDAILKQVATYDGGIASDALWQLRGTSTIGRTMPQAAPSARRSSSPS